VDGVHDINLPQSIELAKRGVLKHLGLRLINLKAGQGYILAVVGKIQPARRVIKKVTPDF
jgi:hypothetical protein